MQNTQEVILERVEQVLPKMPEADLSYILGYGEGLAAGIERAQQRESQQKAELQEVKG